MIRVTFGNQRGGVGKTTSAVTIARLWAEAGLKTLLIDADPQGSIGSILRDLNPKLFLNDFLWNARLLKNCVVSPIQNLDILCSNRDTLEAEQRAIAAIGREQLFEKQFGKWDSPYDAVIVDVGPSLSLLQICSLVYTTDFVLPISMDALSVTGATAFFNCAYDLEEQVKKKCRCVGLLPTIVDQRYQNTTVVLKMIEQLSERTKAPILPAIRTDAVVAKAIRKRQFIADLDPKARCLDDYRALSAQLLSFYGVTETVNVPNNEGAVAVEAAE